MNDIEKQEDFVASSNTDRVLSKGGSVFFQKINDIYSVRITFQSKMLTNRYFGSAENTNLMVALEKACFDLFVNRATQLNASLRYNDVRPNDEFSETKDH